MCENVLKDMQKRTKCKHKNGGSFYNISVHKTKTKVVKCIKIVVKYFGMYILIKACPDF